MKSSRVLIAVLAVSCLAVVSSAAVLDIQGVNGATIAGWTTYTQGGDYGSKLIGPENGTDMQLWYAEYTSSDLSTALADPGTAIVSATLIYSRGYTGSNSPNAITVGEPLYDYTLDTGNYQSAYHMQLIGGNRGNVLLEASRVCSAAEAVINPADENGPYAGTHSVDVTAIVQDWKNGLQSYNCSLGMSATPVYENLAYSAFLPYLKVTTAPALEPTTMCLLAAGGIATVLRRRRSA